VYSIADHLATAEVYLGFLSQVDTENWDFQDGGVVRVNPTVVGLSEFERLKRDAKPDFVISLGTCSSP
jgi:hypothetical protein